MAKAKTKEEAAPAARTNSSAILKKWATSGHDYMVRDTANPDVDRRRHVPTGIFDIDRQAMGGFPTHSFTLLVGQKSSGKSTLTDRVTGVAQKLWPKHKVVHIDIEGTKDLGWAQKHGVDISPDKYMLIRPDTAEDGLNAADELLDAADVSMLVLDSVAALLPSKLEAKAIGEDVVALRARLVGDFLVKASAKLVAARNEGRPLMVVLVNQWRHKIVFMGDPKTIPGGLALDFYPSLTLSMAAFENFAKNGHGDEITDFIEITTGTLKSKLGPKIKSAKFRMVLNPAFPRGVGWIDQAGTILDFADKRGLTERASAGGHCGLEKYGGEKFKTLKAREEWLADRPDIFQDLYEDCMLAWRIESGKGDGEWKAGA